MASVVSDSLRPHGLQPARLLCQWDSPGKIAGVGAMPFSRGSSQPRDWTCISCISCISRQVLHHHMESLLPSWAAITLYSNILCCVESRQEITHEMWSFFFSAVDTADFCVEVNKGSGMEQNETRELATIKAVRGSLHALFGGLIIHFLFVQRIRQLPGLHLTGAVFAGCSPSCCCSLHPLDRQPSRGSFCVTQPFPLVVPK